MLKCFNQRDSNRKIHQYQSKHDIFPLFSFLKSLWEWLKRLWNKSKKLKFLFILSFSSIGFSFSYWIILFCQILITNLLIKSNNYFDINYLLLNFIFYNYWDGMISSHHTSPNNYNYVMAIVFWILNYISRKCAFLTLILRCSLLAQLLLNVLDQGRIQFNIMVHPIISIWNSLYCD